MRSGAIVIIVGAILLSGQNTHAGDWPSWRGPNRDDVSLETGLLKSWPDGGPKKLWTCKDVGLGWI